MQTVWTFLVYFWLLGGLHAHRLPLRTGLELILMKSYGGVRPGPGRKQLDYGVDPRSSEAAPGSLASILCH